MSEQDRHIMGLLFKLRLYTGLAFMWFVAVFALIAYKIDNTNWDYQGYGSYFLVTIFAICLIRGWYKAATFASTLDQKEKHYDIRTDDFVACGYTDELLEAALEEVLDSAKVNKDHYKLLLCDNATPNAYAAGAGTNKVITLHAGILKLLNKQQVQGVVAHEAAHHLNQDIYLTVFVLGAVTTFTYLAGLMLTWARNFALIELVSDALGSDGKKSSSSKDKKANYSASMVCFVLSIVFFIFGYILAPIVASFISRQREYLADAVATKLGFGKGLAEALEKLKNAQKSKTNDNVKAALYINSTKTIVLDILKLFDTHPDLDERIRQIEATLAKDANAEYKASLSAKLKSAFTTYVPVVAGGIFLSMSGKVLNLPNILDIPLLYIAGCLWFIAVQLLLNIPPLTGWTIGQKSNENTTSQATNTTKAIIGIMLFLAIYASGIWAVWESRFLNYPIDFSGIYMPMLSLWILKPVLNLLAIKLSMAGMISEIVNYYSLTYALMIVGSLLYLAI